MTNKRWIVAVMALASCWKSGTTEPKHAGSPNVNVALASVTLGDCGGGVAQERSSTASRQECDPSAIVLALTSTGEATKIRIKKVEVLSADHHSLGTLAATKPALWNASAYVPWDEALAAQQTAQVSYNLPAFDWSQVPGGKYSPAPLTVRVTLEVGSEERTIEKQTEIQSTPDPDVVT